MFTTTPKRYSRKNNRRVTGEYLPVMRVPKTVAVTTPMVLKVVKIMNNDLVCPKCGCTKFYQEKNGRKRCANCQKERMKKYYSTDEYKRKHREADRFRRRGCTKEEYDQKMQEQHETCAICGKKVGKELRIDHNHETGNLRGLLCDSCNWGLGNFKDNIELLRKAISYLERYEK